MNCWQLDRYAQIERIPRDIIIGLCPLETAKQVGTTVPSLESDVDIPSSLMKLSLADVETPIVTEQMLQIQ